MKKQEKVSLLVESMKNKIKYFFISLKTKKLLSRNKKKTRSIYYLLFQIGCSRFMFLFVLNNFAVVARISVKKMFGSMASKLHILYMQGK